MTKHGILTEKWSVTNFSTANYPIQETLELRFSKAPFYQMNFVQRYSVPGACPSPQVRAGFHTPSHCVPRDSNFLEQRTSVIHSLNSGTNFPRIKIWRILQSIKFFSETFSKKEQEKFLLLFLRAEQPVLNWSGGTSWEPPVRPQILKRSACLET